MSTRLSFISSLWLALPTRLCSYPSLLFAHSFIHPFTHVRVPLWCSPLLLPVRSTYVSPRGDVLATPLSGAAAAAATAGGGRCGGVGPSGAPGGAGRSTAALAAPPSCSAADRPAAISAETPPSPGRARPAAACSVTAGSTAACARPASSRVGDQSPLVRAAPRLWSLAAQHPSSAAAGHFTAAGHDDRHFGY